MSERDGIVSISRDRIGGLASAPVNGLDCNAGGCTLFTSTGMGMGIATDIKPRHFRYSTDGDETAYCLVCLLSDKGARGTQIEDIEKHIGVNSIGS